jgi:hypothetical protein
MSKIKVLKEIFEHKIQILRKDHLTPAKLELFISEIIGIAEDMGFDMDLFEIDGEFLDIIDGVSQICGPDVVKSIYIYYNADHDDPCSEPDIYYEWK